ncbi:TniQ family protein [Streptomyces roseus]|uniref:TniQ family protein n=1 Tax=Streptomyces roseus TaxID=66430 RepID=UPI0036A7BD1F
MPHLPDPLPRALAPLPGEGLPGLLLRLSHRLDMSPLQVLIRAGAVKPPAASVPGQLLVTLGSRLKLFAHTTRLTADEAAALTLEPHGERFPPVTESLRIQTQHRFTWARIDPWVLSTFTRYCPKCLAGDGSVIQKRHGGPWKAEWRLAVSFICREHRTFLRHLCPTCRRPAHKFDAQAGSKLLPLMQFKELHPAQCRNPAQDQDVLDPICGARLDTPPASPRLPAASPALLHLQDRIGALLDGAGSPQTAREYFTDLRILSAIILATWPLAREFNPAPLTKAVEHHLTMHRREIDALPGERRQRTWDRPPEPAIASAALLHTADQILALDQHDRDEALRSMLRSGPDPDSGKWGRTDLHLFHASLSFRSAVMQARDRRSQNLARGPSSRLGSDSYRPEHIPQWLPDHWLQYPNGDLLAPRLRHPMQRRAAAVRLIQMVSRMGVQAAALPRHPRYLARAPSRQPTLAHRPVPQRPRDRTPGEPDQRHHLHNRLPPPPDQPGDLDAAPNALGHYLGAGHSEARHHPTRR